MLLVESNSSKCTHLKLTGLDLSLRLNHGCESYPDKQLVQALQITTQYTIIAQEPKPCNLPTVHRM